MRDEGTRVSWVGDSVSLKEQNKSSRYVKSLGLITCSKAKLGIDLGDRSENVDVN